jgi:hypothetical protein
MVWLNGLASRIFASAPSGKSVGFSTVAAVATGAAAVGLPVFPPHPAQSNPTTAHAANAERFMWRSFLRLLSLDYSFDVLDTENTGALGVGQIG